MITGIIIRKYHKIRTVIDKIIIIYIFVVRGFIRCGIFSNVLVKPLAAKLDGIKIKSANIIIGAGGNMTFRLYRTCLTVSLQNKRIQTGM